MPELTAERAREALHYCPITGAFERKEARRGMGVYRVGYDEPGKYSYIRVDGSSYLAHRLAWLITHGVWPSADIDHVNGNKQDNRIANLRPATRAENMANTSCRSKVGLKGVVKIGARYRAQITINRKTVYLGLFGSPADAHDAYVAAAKSAFREFSRSQ